MQKFGAIKVYALIASFYNGTWKIMPKIDFTFHGNLQGVIVIDAINGHGDKIDVCTMSAPELCRKLDSGELSIQLGPCLYDNENAEIVMEDFKTTPGWPDEV